MTKDRLKSEREGNWRRELVKEKSLWEIYKQSEGIFRSPFNTSVFFISISVTLLSISFIFNYFVDSEKEIIHNLVLELLNLSLIYVISILAFSIAAFSIFSSFTDKNIFKELAQLYEFSDQV